MSSFWDGRSVLVTGHTGFKGAWLTTWLEARGAEVTGLALIPHTEPSLWAMVAPHRKATSIEGDIRQADVLTDAFDRAQPEVVFHLAAQALVRKGYREPADTFDINTVGTVRLLDAALASPTARVVVDVTSDKVYDEESGIQPYDENSPLGGHDPYSASKVCAELVASAYRASFASQAGLVVSTVRAGNVIGGGDWSTDRLVPDLVRALEKAQPVKLRCPAATRPWQHVLDPLHGYLMVAERLALAPEGMPPALNFGPGLSSCVPAASVADRITDRWGGQPGWVPDAVESRPEAPRLALSSKLASEMLGWRPRLDFEQALAWTADWYSAYLRGEDVESLTRAQIEEFEGLA